MMRFPHQWQLVILPISGVLLGLLCWGPVLFLWSLTLPAAWVDSVVQLPFNTGVLSTLPELNPTETLIVRLTSFIPPSSAVILFLGGYFLALRNNRIVPEDESPPFDVTPELIQDMARAPHEVEPPRPPL